MPVDHRPVRQEARPPSTDVAEVAPGVLRLQLPISMPGLGHVNCYALEDERGLAVVDPGMPGPGTWRALTDRLRQVGAAPHAVHTVIVTHSHPDHFGGASKLRSETGAEVVTHRSFRAWLDADEEGDPDALDPDAIRGHHGERLDAIHRAAAAAGRATVAAVTQQVFHSRARGHMAERDLRPSRAPAASGTGGGRRPGAGPRLRSGGVTRVTVAQASNALFLPPEAERTRGRGPSGPVRSTKSGRHVSNAVFLPPEAERTRGRGPSGPVRSTKSGRHVSNAVFLPFDI
jgi:hypothetical protein